MNKKIKLVITDVDGVLTDGGMYYSEKGDELKKFNTRDGVGVRLLQEAGIDVCIMTNESTDIVKRRAEKLNISLVFQGVRDKKAKVLEILGRKDLQPDEVAYIGDDINDIEVMKLVGFSATVSDGINIVKEIADCVCSKRGGEGAFREFADLILEKRHGERDAK